MDDVRVVIQIADAHAHVVMEVVRHGDGEADAQDSVCQAKHIKIPILEVKQGRTGSPYKRYGRKQRTGNMGDREETCCNRHRLCRRGDPKQTAEKEDLQQKLLHQ